MTNGTNYLMGYIIIKSYDHSSVAENMYARKQRYKSKENSEKDIISMLIDYAGSLPLILVRERE